MTKLFKLSFDIYRVFLISVLPIFIFSKFIVGMAGHNAPVTNSDYLLVSFAIVTTTLLTIFKNNSITDKLTIFLRCTIAGLTLINSAFLFYQLYDLYLLYNSQNFEIADSIISVLIVILLLICVLVFYGMFKNLPYKAK